MHVVRGRAGTIEDDREASRRLLDLAAGGEPAVRVWIPHRQVAFGRRDARREGYEAARRTARERGFPPVERGVGGRAVAYDGETTLAFARAEPVADFREGTDDRYERLTGDVERALAADLLDGAAALERGEPEASFCPGAHSLSVRAREGGRLRKVVGIAQRVRSDAAVTSGIAMVGAERSIADVLAPIYGAIDVPFDPKSVGSLAGTGCREPPASVARRLESALVVDDETTVETLDAES